MTNDGNHRLTGKAAIVTGAGSIPGPGVGTGKAIAVAMAQRGASVLLADIVPERAEETLEMIQADGGQAVVFAGDLTQAADCEAMVGAARDAFGSVDILVNNIGLPIRGTVVEVTEEDWDRGLNANLRTTFLSSKFAIPAMVESGGGSIINISSITAMRGNGAAVYSAAKGAILALTSDMAYSHGRDGIRVNAIVPGFIYTPMIIGEYGDSAPMMAELRKACGLLGTEGTGWDVAWLATFLASDEARWITGTSIPVDAGMLTAAPLMMLGHMMGAMKS
jgi:NAD(P)-dependent dehydrogenase (short-subunit alcohol dehydrogenase family)